MYFVFVCSKFLYMVTYDECLTFGDYVSNIDFDSDLLCMRYASMLWHYGLRKEEEKAQSDDEAPMRPVRKSKITSVTEIFEVYLYLLYLTIEL